LRVVAASNTVGKKGFNEI